MGNKISKKKTMTCENCIQKNFEKSKILEGLDRKTLKKYIVKYESIEAKLIDMHYEPGDPDSEKLYNDKKNWIIMNHRLRNNFIHSNNYNNVIYLEFYACDKCVGYNKKEFTYHPKGIKITKK